MMLLRANAFASNHFRPAGGARRAADRLPDAGLTVIPQKGSVGASGDLASAHMAGAVCGFEEAEMVYEGRRPPARPSRWPGSIRFRARRQRMLYALINGSTTSLALGALPVTTPVGS